ncbi:hypothetical protein POM88_040624 [Heracleum sosnowskyi]|uniref:BED-type domain-containing protein n=1 Tax=Heracleum sosnowskyi TaxID=360622 RepID=A0AAD8HEE9_9APIA|nr:hypothetical protein POM88_040624 [Heracleum sosnowskyi]
MEIEDPPEDINTNFPKSSKKRKTMKPRSDVWQYFEKFTNDLGEVRGRCLHCNKDYTAEPRNRTSGLINHMKSCKVYNTDSVQTQISFKPSKEGDYALGVWKFDARIARNALAKMIVLDELPFKFVDGEGFKEFIAAVCPKFHISSRWTIARDCYDHKGKAIAMLIEKCMRE